jgi:thioredoxin-dependent peroxiredoxin
MSLKVDVGDALPSVGLRATDGYLLNLRSFVTKQPAVLVFFAAPTATGAAKRRGTKTVEAMVAGHERLREAGIAMAGITTDSEQQQAAFAAKQELPFLLLSDERLSAVNVLGVDTAAVGANVNVARPTALVVDTEGFLRVILDPVEPEALVDLAIRTLAEPLPAVAGDAPTPS